MQEKLEKVAYFSKIAEFSVLPKTFILVFIAFDMYNFDFGWTEEDQDIKFWILKGI